MKVVLFCGGLGTRLRDYSQEIPKPLVKVGYRPILWHVMKYYAHYGHKEFILCLGYKADMIKEYFLKYDEFLSNDFIWTHGGVDKQLLRTDTYDWKITFVDTGLHSNIGTRLKKVQGYLQNEEYFLANYADGLTDMPLDEEIAFAKRSGKTACFMCSRPSQTFHVITQDADKTVTDINYVNQSGIWINAGFYVFRKDIFEHLELGEDLVEQPFHRLIQKRQLVAYNYERFWAMDTFKEQQELSDRCLQGNAPWEVWKSSENGGASRP
jgi:glucose-1-phosphate cytidylyltransferase